MTHSPAEGWFHQGPFFSIPSEVMTHRFIKFYIEWPIKFSKLLDDFLVDLYVSSAFGLAQASGLTAALRLLQAREAFRSVEVEVLVRDDAFEAEEVLHAAQLSGRVCDEPLPADKMDLREAKVLQPVLQVNDVHPYANGVPGGVHDALASVLESKILERGDVGLLGQSLCVVRMCV